MRVREHQNSITDRDSKDILTFEAQLKDYRLWLVSILLRVISVGHKNIESKFDRSL
jgi:hypothetical protein